MQLEDFFDFIGDPVEAIRLKGTRIDLEYVVGLYEQYMTPEQMSAHYGGSVKPVLLYAAVTYYLANRAEVEAYVARREAAGATNVRAHEALPQSPLARRLEGVKARLASGGPFTDAELASESFLRLRNYWSTRKADAMSDAAAQRLTSPHAEYGVPQPASPT